MCRQFAGSESPSVMVVGTKLDLVEVGCRREVGEQEARQGAHRLGALYMGNTTLTRSESHIVKQICVLKNVFKAPIVPS